MAGERKKLSSSGQDEKKVEQKGALAPADQEPSSTILPTDLEIRIMSFLDIVSHAKYKQTSKAGHYAASRREIEYKDQFTELTAEKQIRNWQREDKEELYIGITNFLLTKKGLVLCMSGLITRSDIEKEVNGRAETFEDRKDGIAKEAKIVAAVIIKIVDLPNFEDLCKKRLINPAWLALTPDEVNVFLIDRYFNALDAGIFQQFAFDSHSRTYHALYRTMLDDICFPAFESKLITYDQAIAIGDTAKSWDVTAKFYGGKPILRLDVNQGVQFLHFLLSPAAKQALEEKLIDVPVAQKLSTYFSYWESIHGRDVSFETNFLETFLTQNGLIALRKNHIDIQNVATLFARCVQPTMKEYERAFRFDVQSAAIGISRNMRGGDECFLFRATRFLQGSAEEKESKLTPQRDSLLDLGDVTWSNKGDVAYALRQQCETLCSDLGIQALENNPPLITWNQACHFSLKTLKALLCANGLSALRQNLIELSMVEKIKPEHLQVFFRFPNSVRILRDGLFDIKELENNWIKTKNLELLLSDAGLIFLEEVEIKVSDALICPSLNLELVLNNLSLLKERNLSVNEALHLRARTLKFVLSDEAAVALDPINGWLKASDLDFIQKPELLSLLLTPAAEEAFRDGLLSTKIIQDWTPGYLAMMLTPNGMLAMKTRLIPPEEVISCSFDVLPTLISGRGLIALSEGVIKLNAVKRADDEKLTKALETHNMALRIFDMRVTGERTTLALILLKDGIRLESISRDDEKEDPGTVKKEVEALIRAEQVKLDIELINRLKKRIPTMVDHEIKEVKLEVKLEVNNIQKIIYTLEALQMYHVNTERRIAMQDVLERQMHILNNVFLEIVAERDQYPGFDKKVKLIGVFKDEYSALVESYLKYIKPSGSELEKFTTIFIDNSALCNLHRKTMAANWAKPAGQVSLHTFLNKDKKTSTSKALHEAVQKYDKDMKKEHKRMGGAGKG